jgi:hypothetical protein
MRRLLEKTPLTSRRGKTDCCENLWRLPPERSAYAKAGNEQMWSDGEQIDPSPTIDQAVNGGFPWLEIQCARCKTPSDVDLAAMKHPPTTFVHDLASRLRCRKCAKAGRRPSATLLQLASQARHPRTEV